MSRRGTNLDLVKKHGIPKRIHDGAKFPFITIAPQCAEGIWWSNKQKLVFLEKLLQDLISELRVDKNRILWNRFKHGWLRYSRFSF